MDSCKHVHHLRLLSFLLVTHGLGDSSYLLSELQILVISLGWNMKPETMTKIPANTIWPTSSQNWDTRTFWRKSWEITKQPCGQITTDKRPWHMESLTCTSYIYINLLQHYKGKKKQLGMNVRWLRLNKKMVLPLKDMPIKYVNLNVTE